MTLHALPLEPMPRVEPTDSVLDEARRSLLTQADALTTLATRLNGEFGEALELIVGCRGQVVVCGMGKSGLIGRKLAATFTCSGTPSIFLHPAEAIHGDLGVVKQHDVMLLLSNSGGTEEVARLLPHFQELGVPLIALVGKRDSALGRAADVVLDTSVEREICPHDFVPTTSALVTLALGDALAVAAMKHRRTTADDLVRCHPGGTLGRRGNGSVRDAMLRESLPIVSPEQRLTDALFAMTAGRCGLVIAVNDARAPVGVVTDGDLRRALIEGQATLNDLTVWDIMTADPVTIREDASLTQAKERMHRLRLKALVVVDGDNQVVGVIEVFDNP